MILKLREEKKGERFSSCYNEFKIKRFKPLCSGVQVTESMTNQKKITYSLQQKHVLQYNMGVEKRKTRFLHYLLLFLEPLFNEISHDYKPCCTRMIKISFRGQSIKSRI